MNLNSVPTEWTPLVNLITNGVIPLLLVMLFIPTLLVLVCKWIIYKKAGMKGWEVLIPIYNDVVLLQITGLPEWYVIFYFIPIANIYITFKVNIELAHKFGEGTIFGILMVFLNIICMPMLAFRKKSVYIGDETNNIEPTTKQFTPDNNFVIESQQNIMNNNIDSLNNNVSEEFKPQENMFDNNNIYTPTIDDNMNNTFNTQTTFTVPDNIGSAFVQENNMNNQVQNTPVENIIQPQMLDTINNNQLNTINKVQEPVVPTTNVVNQSQVGIPAMNFIQQPSTENQNLSQNNPQATFITSNNSMEQPVNPMPQQSAFVYGNQFVGEQNTSQSQMAMTSMNNPQQQFVQNQNPNNNPYNQNI